MSITSRLSVACGSAASPLELSGFRDFHVPRFYPQLCSSFFG